MPSPDEREAALFAAALEKSAAERAAFLDRECQGEPALRRRLEALLGAHEQGETHLDPSPSPLPASNALSGRGTPDSAPPPTGLPSEGAPANFAQRMTPELAAAHVASRRKAIREWAKAHREFVKELETERTRANAR